MFGNRGDGLPTLLDGIGDQTHAAEFTGDKQAGNVRLELRRNDRNIDAAPGGAKNQFDGVDRARRFASAVANARPGIEQLGLAADHADDAAFRASISAGAAPDAAGGIDDGVQ